MDEPGDQVAILRERARQHLPGGNTRTTVHMPPTTPYLVHGSGCWVTDMSGRRLIDLQNNYTALIHGHAEPSVTLAGQRALAAGASFGMPTPAEVELAQRLAARLPNAPSWRFTNSGSEAVMYALRTARAFTGRTDVIRFAGSYHGGYDEMLDPGAGLPAGARPAVHILPQADASAVTSVLRANKDTIAAVIVDLMPNRAGLRPLPRAFVETLRRETSATGAVLIVDEVITLRLAPGGFQAAYRVAPDLTTLGKLIGGGLPVGAFGGREDIMGCLDPSRSNRVEHGGTFNANPVVMAMGCAALKLLDGAAIDRINALGDRLRAGLQDLGLEVTGSGSLLRLLGGDRQRELWWQLYHAGVLVCGNGLMAVSTAMSDEIVDDVLVRAGTLV